MIARLLTKQWMLLALAGFLYFAAWNRGVNLLYGFVAIAFAAWMVARWSPRAALNGVRAARSAPATAFEGETVTLHVDVDNEARVSRRVIDVVDRVPGADGSDVHPSVFVARVAPRSRRSFDYPIVCERRGLHTLGPLRLRSGFPLGFAWRERTLPETTASILVYPGLFPIARLPFATALHSRRFGQEPAMHSGGNQEFFGTREYRPGDSPRAVHWASSARRGELIVKEFESRHAADLTIVLDAAAESNVGRGRMSTFEYAVRIAASIADHALAHGHAVRVLAYGAQPLHVPLGTGFPQRARMLDALARIEADGRTPYGDAIARAAAPLGNGGNAVLFLAADGRHSDGIRAALGVLATRRIRPLCVAFDRASFGDTRAQPLERVVAATLSGNGPVYRVCQGDDLARVFAR